MDLFHLEYFCTVALTQNISEAARRHYISQPAMSKYMSNIERELQTPLFIRNGNQIKLSGEGEKFYTYAKRVVSEYNDALGALREGKERVSIYIQVNSTRHILLHYLEEYLPAHPNVDLFLDFNSSRETLESDVAGNMYHFCIGTILHDSYLDRSVPLFSERLMLALPKDHPLAQRDRVSVGDLKEEAFVLQAKNKNYAKVLVQCCRDHGFEPQVRLLCNETNYQCSMVATGVGVSIMPEFSWGDMIGEDIKLVMIDELKNDLHCHSLFWNDNRFYPKEMVEFREGLVKYYHNIGRKKREPV